MANPNRDVWLDSFQGKSADDVLGTANEQTLDALRSDGYRVDGTGSPNPQDPDYNPQHGKLYNPYRGQKPGYTLGYGQTVNNPAPPDPSRFDPPPPDPIRITQDETLTVPSVGVDPRDIDIDVSESGKLERIQVSPGRTDETVNRFSDRGRFEQFDAPEDAIDPADRDEADVDLAGYADKSGDGSELGPPIGLNESARTKIEITESKTAVAANSGPFMEDLSEIQIDPRPNELNVFSSYTYNIALYMMNSKSYVDITTSPSTPEQALQYPNSLLLMRSGGTGLDNSQTAFGNDFYIDDLEITNVAVGPNKFKQNTNATDIKFTITEPRGVRLLERLRDAAASVVAGTNERYIHAPYLLEISFKGYDSEGRPLGAPSTPKYIPIKITDIQFEVTAMGTQYQVTAIPFANHVMGQVMSIIPFNIEIHATTVGDIFSNGITIERTEQERVNTYDDDDGGEATGQTVGKKTVKSKAKNLGEVLTIYQKNRTKPTKQLVEKDLEVTEKEIPPAAEGYDTYKFAIAAEIANAKLNIDGLYDALNTPAPTEETKEKNSKDKSDVSQFDAYVKGIGQGVTLDKTTSTFKINAGTDITKLINLVIMHSDYMDKNVVDDPDQNVSDSKPIKWFTIRTVIDKVDGEGKGFDKKDGRYKYAMTFNVEKTNVYYNDFPWAPKSKPKGNGFHKVYNYIFSGQNVDVLDFGLKFRTAFIQTMTAGTGNPSGNKDPNEVLAPIVKELPQSPEGNTVNGPNTVKRARAKDLFSSVMRDGVDLIDLNLQIIGDPAYLTTSDAYWQDKIREGKLYTTPFMPDGTINYNLTQPYIQVNLKTPVDYNETSGLANPNTGLENSEFSGIYQLTGVMSSFSGGEFRQKLEGVRTGLQPTSSGVARSENQTAGKERDITAKDDEFDSKDPQAIGRGRNTGITNNRATVRGNEDPYSVGYYGEFGGQVEQEPPYTSPTVNNERTAQIAQEADQSVQVINDVDDVSATDAWLARWPTN